MIKPFSSQRHYKSNQNDTAIVGSWGNCRILTNWEFAILMWEERIELSEHTLLGIDPIDNHHFVLFSLNTHNCRPKWRETYPEIRIRSCQIIHKPNQRFAHKHPD